MIIVTQLFNPVFHFLLVVSIASAQPSSKSRNLPDCARRSRRALLFLLQSPDLLTAGAAVLYSLTVDAATPTPRILAPADFSLAVEVSQRYVEGVYVGRDDGEEEEQRVEEEVLASTAQHVHCQWREEDVYDCDDESFQHHDGQKFFVPRDVVLRVELPVCVSSRERRRNWAVVLECARCSMRADYSPVLLYLWRP